MNECELCQQEPYLNEQRPCPWHEPEVIEEHIRQWAEYHQRKEADPEYCIGDDERGLSPTWMGGKLHHYG